MVEDKVVLENNLVKWFSKLGVRNSGLAGEKGAKLGEIRKLKVPVPEGFVITTKAYDFFVNENNLKEKIKSFLSQIDLSNQGQLENYVSKVKEDILKASFPEDLRQEILESYDYLSTDRLDLEEGSALDILNSSAEPIFISVRSSVPFQSERTNWLREQDTYLNVKGNEELLKHIKRCFASLFNPNTIRRYLESGEDIKELKIAVVVQKMIQGDKSGVVYSRDGSGNIVVRSIWGLGEGMNLSDINPDKFIVSRDLEILDQKIDKKEFGVVRDAGGNLKKVKLTLERSSFPSLSKSELQRIGDLAEKIEEHFERPQELEFVIDNDIFILQTKDFGGEINVKKTKNEEKVERKEERVVEEKKIKSNIERIEKVTKTKLKLSIQSPNFVEDYKETGLKKVGLFNLENLIFESGKHPDFYLKNNYINQYENLIYGGIKKVVEGFEEVWVSTSDFLSKDFSKLDGAPDVKEDNPLMGLHGIRYGLRNLDVLEAELRAFKRADEGRNRIGVLIPGLISIEELQKVRDLMIELDYDPKVGVVLETPASVQLIKDFADSNIQKVLINLDSLVQYLLAIDLSNEQVKGLYDSKHPALMYQLQYVIRVCKRRNLEVSVFGGSLEDESLLDYLVQREISSICVSPDDAKDYSEIIFEIEREAFGGTDKEPRQYEVNKEKEEYLEDVPKTMED